MEPTDPATAPCEDSTNQECEPPPPKRPPRKRFDEEMDKLGNLIKSKEATLRSLQNAADSTVPAVSSACSSATTGAVASSSVWQKRDEIITRRRAIDERLQAANKEIANKRDALARIHSTLNYKSEDRINEAIKRLEYQLRVNNFKVNEEKRIVKEIDNLNRSKRNLKEYLDKKCELDSVMKKQQEMRNERDTLFRAGTELTQKGEMLKKEMKERKAKAEQIKKELDDLYSEKRQLAANYRQSFSRYQHYRAQLKKQLQKKDDSCDKEDVENVRKESFSEERQLCMMLLGYLQRFEFNQVTSALTPCMAPNDFLAAFQLPASEGNTPISSLEEITLLRRKEESGDEDWCCASGRGTRARRNQTKKLRQQQKKKRIKHTPEVFEQFSRLQLSAPSLLSEVPVAIEQLKAKKKFYEHLAQAEDLTEIPDLPLYSLSSTNADAKIVDQNCDVQISTTEEHLPVLQEVQPSNDDEKNQLQVKKPSFISTNSVPKTLDLVPSMYSLRLNGYQNGLDELDMGYSSENGYSKFEGNNGIMTL